MKHLEDDQPSILAGAHRDSGTKVTKYDYHARWSGLSVSNICIIELEMLRGLREDGIVSSDNFSREIAAVDISAGWWHECRMMPMYFQGRSRISKDG